MTAEDGLKIKNIDTFWGGGRNKNKKIFSLFSGFFRAAGPTCKKKDFNFFWAISTGGGLDDQGIKKSLP
jgi:hypothetical protein